MTIINVAGIKHRIDVTSIDEYKALGDEHSKKAVINLILAGGFGASYFTREQIDAFLALPDLHEVYAKELENFKPGPVILMLSDIAEQLAEEEKFALLLHEEAHIEYDDVAVARTAKVVPDSEVKLVAIVENELQADAYAAARTNKATVRSALLKVVRKQAELLSKIISGDTSKAEQIFNESIGQDHMVARLAALI